METASSIAEMHLQRRAWRSKVLDDYLPFSWPRVMAALFVYLLLCSDVPRTGLGVADMSAFAKEPDTFQYYGPWHYHVHTIAFNETTPMPRVWSYKYDTTSIVWRAFAKHFQLEHVFPLCILYQSECPELHLARHKVFQMMDALVNATASYNPSKQRPNEPTTVMIRSKNTYRDRFHHYLLPELFVNPVWRTHQALYYPPSILRDATTDLCNTRTKRPNLCADPWSNFLYACPSNDIECRQVGLMYVHMMQRYRQLQARFNSSSIDLLILESDEDVQVCKGGLSMQGRRLQDVTTILRVLDCTNASSVGCTTLLVDDYRYENAVFTSDVVHWYTITATLRAIAQGYFYLRLVMLFGSCYLTRAAEESYRNRPIATLRAAITTFSKIPPQCIVYGSPVPILCYALAHIIDAPMTYELIAQRFTTLAGSFDITFWEFALMSAVQMRNVWLLAMALHLVVYVSTKTSAWTPAKGVCGLPEFSISVFSGLTIFTQFRRIEYRNTHVTDVFEILHSNHQENTNRFTYNAKGGGGNMLLEGVVLDFKMFFVLALVSIAVIVMIQVGLWLLGDRIDRNKVQKSYLWQLCFLIRTPVPYSAGTLWPTVAMSVCWRTDVLPRRRRTMQSFVATEQTVTYKTWWKKTITPKPEPRKSELTTRPSARWSLAMQDTVSMEKQMEDLQVRRDDVHAIVAWINLVAMSDPITFLKLKVFKGKPLAYCRCTRTNQVVLLPYTTLLTRPSTNVPWDEFHILKIVNSKQLSWSNLIHCG